MDDPACKWLFSRPRMVRDLLRGFAARDWSGVLDSRRSCRFRPTT